ncbi:ubiquitin-protein transferase [Aureococcus anophagefferens]|nr:ubiquitin-protein transferase [Aureococcus anophagefferens]
MTAPSPIGDPAVIRVGEESEESIALDSNADRPTTPAAANGDTGNRLTALGLARRMEAELSSDDEAPSDAAQEAPSALFQLGQLIAAEQVPPRELLGRALEDMGYHQQMVRIANAGQQLPEEVQDALIARARDTFTSPPHVRSTAPPAVQDASRAALEDTPVRPTAPPAVQDAGRADDDSPRASSATSLRTFASPGVPPAPARARSAPEQQRHHTPVRTTVPPAVQAAGRADVDSSSPGAPRVPPAATRRPATEVSNLPPDACLRVWTREEETTLLRLVFELGANKWEDVASRLEEAPVPYQIRTASECEALELHLGAGLPETDRETPRLTIEKYVAGQRKFALAGKSFDADAVFDDLVSHLEDDLEDDDSCKKNVRDLLLLSVKPSNAAPILAAGAVSPLVELLTDDVLIAVEKAKVSLKIAMAEASKAQRELSMSAAAARGPRVADAARIGDVVAQARYELEAANASLERCLGWMAGATPDGGDAAAHRDKRAKMEAADEATTCVVCRDRPRSLVLLPCARAPLQRVRDVDPGHVEVVPHLPRDHRQDDRVPPRLGIC